MRWFAALIFTSVGLTACVDDPESRCTTHVNPSFELGTGAESFETLEAGQDLFMEAGLQGSCHFWLSFRTDGFSAQRVVVSYDIRLSPLGAETGNASFGEVELAASDAGEGLCEYVGFTAFLEQPWTFEDQHIELAVTLTDEDARTSSVAREVVARWPRSGPGGDPRYWCGFRE